MQPPQDIAAVAPYAARIAAATRHVTINHPKIAPYTTFLLGRYPLVGVLDAQNHHIADTPAETAGYVIALDSINFGSGYFDETGLEYDTIARGLKDAFARGDMNTPEQWAKATPGFFIDAFGMQPHPLASLFAQHLRATGERMIADFQGKPMHLVEAAQGSAYVLADIVAGWDNFADPFFKRAQILAADMHLAIGPLRDMDKLTIFADNMVPHVLRYDGILTYSEELATAIDAGHPLPAGSDMEMELRAAAIHAVELMRDAAPEGITAVNLDHLLWHRGYEPDMYARPRHKTRTTAY